MLIDTLRECPNLRRLELLSYNFGRMKELCDVLSLPSSKVDHLGISTFHDDLVTGLLLAKKNFIRFHIRTAGWNVDARKAFYAALSLNKTLVDLKIEFPDHEGADEIELSTLEALPNLKTLNFHPNCTNFTSMFRNPRLTALTIQSLRQHFLIDEMDALNNNTTLRSFTDLTYNDPPLILNGSIVNGGWISLCQKNRKMHEKVRKIVCIVISRQKSNTYFAKLCKDVLIIIMKLIYHSRLDWRVWEPERALSLSETDQVLIH
jgi:hypothetical protein